MAVILFLDSETTGLWQFGASPTAVCQPHLVQLAAVLRDDDGSSRGEVNLLITPEDWKISPEVAKIHGVDHDLAMRTGVTLANACYVFKDLVADADIVVAHNLAYDRNVMTRALHEAEIDPIPWENLEQRCTMLAATPVVKVRKANARRPGDWKWPKLAECIRYFFQEDLQGAHDAMIDVRACMRVHDELINCGAFS